MGSGWPSMVVWFLFQILSTCVSVQLVKKGREEERS